MVNFRRRSSRTGPRVEADRRGSDPKRFGDAVSADDVLRANAAAEGSRRDSSNDGGGKNNMSAAGTRLEYSGADDRDPSSFTGANPMLPQKNNSSDGGQPDGLVRIHTHTYSSR